MLTDGAALDGAGAGEVATAATEVGEVLTAAELLAASDFLGTVNVTVISMVLVPETLVEVSTWISSVHVET